MTRKTREVAVMAVVLVIVTMAIQWTLRAAFGPGALAGFWGGGVMVLVADAWGRAVRRKHERQGE